MDGNSCLVVAVIAVGIVLPFGIWWVHDRRERQRAKLEEAIAGFYAESDPTAGDGEPIGRRYRRPASSGPD